MKNNGQIFLIDGLGAIISVVLLAGLLANFENIFGMPKAILYKLSILPMVFATYSLSCHFLKPENWSFYLKGIAFGNICYCFLTLGLGLQHRTKLTNLGFAYFFVEIVIILLLSALELRIAKK